MSGKDPTLLSSKRGNLAGLWTLARPANLLYASATLLLLRFGWMTRWAPEGQFLSLPLDLFLEGLLVVVLLMAAGNWINAYFDVVEDRINRPDRAIVDRTVKRRVLIVAHPVTHFIALCLALHLSVQLDRWAPLILSAAVAFVLWMYSARWKSIPLVGNGMVAALIGLVPVWLGLLEAPFHAASEAELRTLWWSLGAYGSLAAGVAMAREIAKDAQDIAGDTAAGKNTFPVRFGASKARILCASLLLFLGVAYAATLWSLELAAHLTEALTWSVPSVGWLWACAEVLRRSPRWDRVSKATLLTLLLGSLQCLWIGPL